MKTVHPRDVRWKTAFEPKHVDIADFGDTLGYEALADIGAGGPGDGTVYVRFYPKNLWVIECHADVREMPSPAVWRAVEKKAEGKALAWGRARKVTPQVSLDDIEIGRGHFPGHQEVTFTIRLRLP